MSSTAADSSVHDFTFPRSISPTKEHLKPNAHPYKIVTTSTALLSRSNSSTKNHSSHHHYVPQTPTSTSPTRKHSDSHHRHRYSSSLSSDNLPRPLPVPPSSANESPNGKSYYTLPPLTLEDLPSNPKLWTSAQLCSYLTTALRVKSGESLQLPHQVARDIAGFVRESKITGRVFLRLDEKDLEAYGVNKLWKTALLRASQHLRSNVLKGQIWGFEDHVDERSNGVTFPFVSPLEDIVPGHENENDEDTPHRRRRSISQPQYTDASTIMSSPFPNGLPVYSSASSSSSTEDLFSPTSISPMISSSGSRFSGQPQGFESHLRHSHRGRTRHGKVKGMIDSFERSASFDDGDPTSVRLLQEIKGMRELDLEQLRKLRRERSGSTSSMSESGSFGSSHSPTSSSDDSNSHNQVVLPVEDEDNYDLLTITRPLPTPPQHTTDYSFPVYASLEEEPSMEDLLAQEEPSEGILRNHPNLASMSTFQGKAGSKSSFAKSTFSISKGKGKAKKRGGVYAWEDEAVDLGAAAPGKATAKRVTSQIPIPAAMIATLSNAGEFSGNLEAIRGIIREESTESTGTGDFAIKTAGGSGSHTPSRPLPEIPLHPSLVPYIVPDNEAELDRGAEESSLRASINETSELLEEFRLRLCAVERKVDVLELEVKQLEMSNASKEQHPADDASRSTAVEQARGDIAAAPMNSVKEWPVVRSILDVLLRRKPASNQLSSAGKQFAYYDPQTLSQLPPYVLLVGLGVCAVVLRVVAKRLGGRR
ncbi:hypothetical protein D9757_000696 [Collybiopsis confluens]|uniref:Uncharacterized protein n=1 Tax=Collybiopsis confluens TaxID=2823264 RepID=A0A8H5I1K5_9AGAR|nr:hypothetical protein D9757_000696 [Collybiopsis confluens]